jgi:hypothetical protein
MSSFNEIHERSGTSTNDGGPAEPPRAPSITRRLALTRKQLIGLPLLAAIPILTLFGVFGEHQSTARTASHALEMTIRYPARFRYRQIQPLDVTVRNASDQTIDTVDVSLDTAYISRFSSVRIEPAPRSAFVVTLTGMRPGESRLISAELWGERYGRHEGRIVATARADTASATVRTIVFP